MDVTHKEWYEVEANSEEEAKDLAEDLADEGEAAVEYGADFISDVRILK